MRIVKERLKTIEEHLHEITDELTDQLKPLASMLTKIYAELDTEHNKYPIEEYRFTNSSSDKIAVGTGEANLIIKEIPFQVQITRWEESEVYPIILSVQERILKIYDRSLSAIFNARNRIKILSGETEDILDFHSDSLQNYIDEILADIEETITILVNAIDTASKRINTELLASQVFSKERLFLQFSSGLALGKYQTPKFSISDSPVIKKIREFFEKYISQRFKVSTIYDDQGKFADVIRFVELKIYH